MMIDDLWTLITNKTPNLFKKTTNSAPGGMAGKGNTKTEIDTNMIINFHEIHLESLNFSNHSLILSDLAAFIQDYAIKEIMTPSVQQKLQVSWSIIIASLYQLDSINRSFSLVLLGSLFPCIQTTIFSFHTKNSIFNTLQIIIVSDERLSNRVMATYLLGEVPSQLGGFKENDPLMDHVIINIVSLTLEFRCPGKTVRPNICKVR